MSEFHLEDINNTVIKLNLTDRITFIGGDSGVGKTYIIGKIKNAILNRHSIKKCNLDISRIIVFDNSNLNKIKDADLVFIDKYDSLDKDTKKKIWDKMEEVQAGWVLMTRYPDIPANLGFSNKSFKELKLSKIGNKKIIETT